MEEDLKDLAEKDSLFAAQLRGLSKAIDRMGPATWELRIGIYSDRFLLEWLNMVAVGCSDFERVAAPIYRRLLRFYKPFDFAKEGLKFFDIGADFSASDFFESLGEQVAAPSKISGRLGTVSGHDSSSPVGDRFSSRNYPTGEGLPPGVSLPAPGLIRDEDLQKQLKVLSDMTRQLDVFRRVNVLENYPGRFLLEWLQILAVAVNDFKRVATPIYCRLLASYRPFEAARQGFEFFGIDEDFFDDSSSPVGDETLPFLSDPAGEGSPQGAISAFERELLEGEGQETLGEEQ